MPLSDHARWRVVLRTLGTLVAVASAVAAIWLIALGDSSNQVRIGVVLGLWSALLGSATLFGTRGGQPQPTELRQADLDRVAEMSMRTVDRAAREAAAGAAQQAAESAARQAVAAVQEAGAGGEVERRRSSEVERERDEAARREFALSLELMLRREMERVLREELDALRQEVAGLRNDLTEKVPGQIRLERIETTRLIGSDLEALQAEVRRLAEERVALGGTPAPAITLGTTPATVRPAEPAAPVTVGPPPVPAASAWSSPSWSAAAAAPAASAPAAAAPAAAERGEPLETTPLPTIEPAVAPAVAPTVDPTAAPAASEQSAPPPAAVAEPSTSPVAADDGADVFAGLPRLSRWVDPYEGVAEPAASAVTEPPADRSGHHVTGGHALPDDAAAADDAARYVGRRRQGAGSQPAHTPLAVVAEPEEHAADRPVAAEPEPEPTGRRHARDDAEPATGGRRRRRAEEDERGGHSRADAVSDDVLARLLGR